MNNEENQQQGNWTYTGSTVADTATATPANASEQNVSWTASEYIAHDKSTGWFVALGSGATVLCALVFLVTQDWIAVVVVGICALLLGIYAVRKPHTRSYLLDQKGLHINDELHPYNKFRSFSVVEEGAINSIWLKPLKRISPVVVVYFAPNEEEKIVNVLSNYLPHEQRELDSIDRLSKQLRF